MIRFLLFLALFSISGALIISDDYEGSCIKPPTVDIDRNLFIDGEKKWYISMGSRYEHIRDLMGLLRQPADKMTQKDLDKSCMYAKFGPDFRYFSNNKSVKFDMEPSKVDYGFDWTIHSKYPGHGRTYIAMTDNKTYMVMINYWEFSSLGWYVLSTGKTLDENIKDEILKQIQSFGFHMQKIHYLIPNSCTD